MATLSNFGTSPAVVISREHMREGKYHKVSSQVVSAVQPPTVNVSNATSSAMTKWVQSWPTINFDKIAVPLFDEHAQYVGVPSNRPDMIKDYHFIGVMRCIDKFLAPTYSAFIFCSTSGPWPTPPPTYP